MRGPRTEMVRAALRPASALWGVVSRSRNLMYDRGIARVWRLPVPVISIGNITAGGTGKTPLAIHLARRLLESGGLPLVLSRGYGSRGTGTRVVSDGKRVLLGSRESGDEPLMIARSVPGLPVVVDPDRVRGGLLAIRRFAPSVILLDDGFQHRRLSRDLDIVLLDAIDPFGRYALLPSGFLREPFSSLARADLFIVTHAPEGERLETLTSIVRRYNQDGPILRARHVPDSLLSVPLREFVPAGPDPSTDPLPEGVRPPDLRMLDGARVFAFCGIGNPEGFRTTLLATGAWLAGFETFRDHHPYTRADLERIAAAARGSSASFIVTTEKDAIRIAEAPAGPGLLALRIRMELFDEHLLLDAVRAVAGA